METVEFYDLFKRPWNIIPTVDNAEGLIRKLCFNDDSKLPAENKQLSDKEIYEKLCNELGTMLIPTTMESLSYLTQQRRLALDSAVERLQYERLYLKQLDGDKSTSRKSKASTRIDDVIAIFNNDKNNAVNFEKVTELDLPESEIEYRYRCIALKLLGLLWMNGELPCISEDTVLFHNSSTHKDYTASTLFYSMINLDRNTQAKEDTLKLRAKSASIVFLLTAPSLDTPLEDNGKTVRSPFANRLIINSIISAINKIEAAHDIYEIILANIMNRGLANKTDNPELEECTTMLSTLKELQEQFTFTAPNNGNELVDNQDGDEQFVKFVKNGTEFTFSLAEVKDVLKDNIALIMNLVDCDDSTYAICECKYDEFLKDPNNKQNWQPADDMFYLRYSPAIDMGSEHQRYTLISTILGNKPDEPRTSLIHVKHCKYCKRIMLPTTGFLNTLTIAARNKDTATGGQFVEEPINKNMVISHTASAIAKKLGAIVKIKESIMMNNKNMNNKQPLNELKFISWPEVTQGTKDSSDILYTNVFSPDSYQDFFSQLNSSVYSAEDQIADEMAEAIECILSADKFAGYTYEDYLYTLISKKQDSEYTMRKYITCCRIIYGIEMVLAYVTQALSALNSSVYDSYICGKYDLYFGYNNLQPLLEKILLPMETATLLGFTDVEHMYSAIKCKDISVTLPPLETLFNIKDIEGDKLIEGLTALKSYYQQLSAIFVAERKAFVDAVKSQDIQTIVPISTLQLEDDTVASSDIEMIEASAGLAEFIDAISDSDAYRNTLCLMAENADISTITDFAKTAADAYLHRKYSSFDDMQCDLHSIALSYIRMNDLPNIDCIHQKFYVDPAAMYDTLISTYARSYAEEVGDCCLLPEDAAEYAIKLYYGCAVEDSVSTKIRYCIKDIVTSE